MINFIFILKLLLINPLNLLHLSHIINLRLGQNSSLLHQHVQDIQLPIEFLS
jgi:hypothetical protein